MLLYAVIWDSRQFFKNILILVRLAVSCFVPYDIIERIFANRCHCGFRVFENPNNRSINQAYTIWLFGFSITHIRRRN